MVSIQSAKKLSAKLSGIVVEKTTYGEKKEAVQWDLLRLNAYIDTLESAEQKKDCCSDEINVISSCLTESDILIIEEQVKEMILTYK
jgi:hypothetical protein